MNDIENWFLGKGADEKSFLSDWMNYLLGENGGKGLMVGYSCFPAINTVVCMWKIYGLKLGEVGGVGLSNRVILDGIVSIV